MAYLHAGQTQILLLQQPKNEQNPSLDRSGGLVMKFYVSEIRKVAINLQERSVKVLQDLEMPAFGERTFLVADPDGYAVLLAEPVETLNRHRQICLPERSGQQQPADAGERRLLPG